MGRKPKIQEGDILKVSGTSPSEDRKKTAAEMVAFLTKQGIEFEHKARGSGGVFWEEIESEYGTIRIYASTSIRIFNGDHRWGPYPLKTTLEELRQRHVG